MNTKEEITQHSQKKLEVYEKYLKAYLSLLLNTRFNPIVIVDLFAGKGRDDKGHDGSAVKAAKLLKTLDHLGKVRLLLNDSSKEYCENFFNHYEAIGWVNGTGQQIKNWKLVFDNWIKKDGKIKIENELDDIIDEAGFSYKNGRRKLC